MDISDIQVQKLEPHYYNYVKAKFNTFNKELSKLNTYMPVVQYSKTDEAFKQYTRDLAHNTLCPFCRYPTEYLHDSTFLYAGIDKGPIYYCACKPGGVYVGCHKHSPKIPLGFPADKHLRQYRQKAHEAFDAHWEEYYDTVKNRDNCNFSKYECREIAYYVLASHMCVTQSHYAHIGWFDVKQCRKVIKLCNNGAILNGLVVMDTFKAIKEMIVLYKNEKDLILDINDKKTLFNAWASLCSEILKANYKKPGKPKTKRKKRK